MLSQKIKKKLEELIMAVSYDPADSPDVRFSLCLTHQVFLSEILVRFLCPSFFLFLRPFFYVSSCFMKNSSFSSWYDNFFSSSINALQMQGSFKASFIKTSYNSKLFKSRTSLSANAG